MCAYVAASMSQLWEMARKHIIKHPVVHDYGLYAIV